MEPKASFLALAPVVALGLLTALGACEDDAAPGTTAFDFDGSTLNVDARPNINEAGAVDSGGDGGTGTPGICTDAGYVNGSIANSTGTLQFHSENNISAQVVVSNGSFPCEAKFDPNAGVLVNSAMSGAFDIQCNGTEDDQYYGVHIHGLGKIGATGTQYVIGKADVVDNALNNQVDLTWEAGSRCGDKAATLREWVGGPTLPAGRGTFFVDELSGSDVRFHVSLTDMKVSSKNVAGTGTFSMTVGTISAAPLTISGM